MQIDITAEDIALGIPGDGAYCPAALALTRQTGLPWRVGPEFHWIWNLVDTGRTYYANSANLKEFVRDTDYGLPIKPLTFTTPWKPKV